MTSADRLDAHFEGKGDFDVVAFMHEHLAAVDRRLMWEYGPAIGRQGHRLVITPESDRTLRPMLGTLLAEAPELPRWQFYPYRLPENPEHALAMVEARRGRRPPGLRGRASRGRGHLIDLDFTGPDDLEELRKDAFVLVETLLGEEMLDHWIGGISAVAEDAGPWLDLEALRASVIARRRAIVEALPERPCHLSAADAEWTVYRLEEPEPSDDYPGRGDLVVARTPEVARAEAAFRDPTLFSSSRFSRLGEVFAYLKLDDEGGAESDRLAARSEFEDALDEVLGPLGAVVGGGTGMRYAYIDLALTDVRRAIPAIREVLRRGEAPLRSWLLFFDAVWLDEWVGIWPETPPPP